MLRSRMRLEQCRRNPGWKGRNVALVHAFLTGGQCSESERPLSVGGTGAVSAQHFNDFQYVAMGHLHRPQQMKNGRLVYSGSLMKYSFEEADHKKGVNCVEMDGAGQLRQEFLPLPSLRDVRVKEGLFEELMKGPRTDENPRRLPEHHPFGRGPGHSGDSPVADNLPENDGDQLPVSAGRAAEDAGAASGPSDIVRHGAVRIVCLLVDRKAALGSATLCNGNLAGGR